MARTKPNEQAQIDFIAELLIKGEQRKTILAKFVKKWQKAGIRTFDRRLKVAQTAVQEQQKRIQKEAEGNIAKKVEALESKIMTSIERKILLTEIARGEVKIPTKEVRWDSKQEKFVTIPYEELPDHGVRVRAMAELSKMCGDYEPQKIDATITEKKLPSWLTDDSKSKS